MSEVIKVSHQKKQVQLTETVKKHIISHLSKRECGIGVRVTLKKTGCSGLSYQFDYVDSINPDDIAIFVSEDYQFFIDKKYYPYMKGSKIDYVKQGLNYKFVIDNPNSTGECGCGESFTID
jgi:iron-sulfur cluster assembly protein